MSAVATLERPRLSPPVVRAAWPEPLDASVRDALVLSAYVAVAFALSGVTSLVSAFGWSTSMLGAAGRYETAAPVALACVLAVVALQAASRSAARGPHRAGATLAVGGACVLVLASAAAVWASALPSRSYARTPQTLLHVLTRASVGGAAAGLLVLALGAAVVRREIDGGPRGAAWRPVLLVLSASLVVGAVAPATDAVTRSLRVVPPELLSSLLVDGAPAVAWLGVATALWLATGALRGDRRTTGLALSAPLAALGAAVLAAGSAATLAYTELVAHGAAAGWQSPLDEAAPTAFWFGAMVVAAALGTAAVRAIDSPRT